METTAEGLTGEVRATGDHRSIIELQGKFRIRIWSESCGRTGVPLFITGGGFA